MNFSSFYDNTENLSTSEIYIYFKNNLFQGQDPSKITLDDLITVFSDKELIENCKNRLDLSTNEFFMFMIKWLKEECDMKSFTRSKKKIAQLQSLVYDLS